MILKRMVISVSMVMDFEGIFHFVSISRLFLVIFAPLGLGAVFHLVFHIFSPFPAFRSFPLHAGPTGSQGKQPLATLACVDEKLRNRQNPHKIKWISFYLVLDGQNRQSPIASDFGSRTQIAALLAVLLYRNV